MNTTINADGRIQPGLDPANGLEIRFYRAKSLDLTDLSGQEVRNDDPDRPAEHLDIGIPVGVALA